MDREPLVNQDLVGSQDSVGNQDPQAGMDQGEKTASKDPKVPREPGANRVHRASLAQQGQMVSLAREESQGHRE